MDLSAIVRATKRNVAVSAWGNERPKRKDFPLSCKRGGAFPITRKWRWAVVEFEAEAAQFRVFVAYHLNVPEFQAVLGEAVGGDTRVLARVEYHLNHPEPGWHVHANCDETDEIAVGMIKPLGQFRVPAAYNRHRRREYVLSGDSMNDNIALSIAAKWFRFSYQAHLFEDG